MEKLPEIEMNEAFRKLSAQIGKIQSEVLETTEIAKNALRLRGLDRRMAADAIAERQDSEAKRLRHLARGISRLVDEVDALGKTSKKGRNHENRH